MSGSDSYTSSAPPLGFDQAWIDDKLKNGSGVDLLTAQILQQKTYDKWTGQGFGTVLENARSIAKRLSDAGIKRLEDFGQVPQYKAAEPIEWTLNGTKVGLNPGVGFYASEPFMGYDDMGVYGVQYRNRYLSAAETNQLKPTTYAKRVYDPESGGDVLIKVPANELKTINGVPSYVSGMQYANKATGQRVLGDQQSNGVLDVTYAGDGSTRFGVSFNELGMPIFFSQYNGSSSDWGSIAPLLSVASFIPGVAPIAMTINALGSAYNGNYVGAALSALGAANAYGTDFLNNTILNPNVPFDQAAEALNGWSGTLAQNLGAVQTAAQAVGVLNALDKKNIAGIISGLGNLAPQVGVNIPSDVIKPLAVASAAAAASKGDWAGALQSASMLSDNPTFKQDAKLASQAAKFVTALKSDNPTAIFSSLVGFAQNNNLGSAVIKDTAKTAGIPISDSVANALSQSPDAEKHAENYVTAVKNDPKFDPEAYLRAYNDLSNAFGDDILAAVDHMANNGIKEGRVTDTWGELAQQKNPGFDAEAYLERYPDLKTQFGDDAEAAAKHYFDIGFKENLDPTVAKAQPEPQPEPEQPKDVVDDLQDAGLTEQPDFADPDAVSKMEQMWKQYQAASNYSRPISSWKNFQLAASNYAGEFSGYTFDPTYIDSEGNAGAYFPTEDTGGEGGLSAEEVQDKVGPPTPTEAAAADEELFKQLEQYLSQQTAGMATKEDVQALIDAGMTPESVKQLIEESGYTSPSDVEDLISKKVDGLATEADLSSLSKDTQEKYNALSEAQKQLANDLADTGIDLKQAIEFASKSSTEQIGALEERITGALKTAIDDAKASGLAGDEALKAAIDKVAADQGTSAESLLEKIGTTESALKTQFADQIGEVKTQIGDVQSSLEQAIQDAKAVGLKGDAALQSAIDKVAGDLGTTKSDLLDQIGATEESLKSQFADQIGEVQSQIGDVQSNLAQAIADAKAAGLEGDAALQSAIEKVAGELGTTKSDLLDQLDTTESQLRSDFAEQIGGVQTQIDQTKQSILDQVAQYEQLGMDRDTALSLAISGVSQELGETKQDLLDRLGTTEEGLLQQISGVSSDLQTKYDSLTADQKALADQLRQQGVDFNTAIQTAQQQTQEQIGQVSADVKAKYDALSEAQKQLANDLADTGLDLQQAIDFASKASSEQIAQVEQGLTEKIGGLQEQVTGLSQDAQSKYEALTEAQKQLANDLADTGIDLRQAIDFAAQASSEQIGALEERLTGALGQQTQQYQQGMSDLEKKFQGMYDSANEQTQSRFDELSDSQKALAASLASSTGDLQSAIDAAAQQSTSQYEQLGGQLSSFQDIVDQRINDLMVQQGLSFQQAQEAVNSELDLMRQDYTSQFAASEAQRAAEAQAAEARRQQDIANQTALQKELARQGAIRTTAGQAATQLQQITGQLPQVLQGLQQTTTPVYAGEMQEFNLENPLDVGFFNLRKEAQSGQKQQQATKIATGGYLDDLLDLLR